MQGWHMTYNNSKQSPTMSHQEAVSLIQGTNNDARKSWRYIYHKEANKKPEFVKHWMYIGLHLKFLYLTIIEERRTVPMCLVPSNSTTINYDFSLRGDGNFDFWHHTQWFLILAKSEWPKNASFKTKVFVWHRPSDRSPFVLVAMPRDLPVTVYGLSSNRPRADYDNCNQYDSSCTNKRSHRTEWVQSNRTWFRIENLKHSSIYLRPTLPKQTTICKIWNFRCRSRTPTFF